jgi:filamentous hemagglutinin family protein
LGWQLVASAAIVGGVATSGNYALGQVVGDTTLGAESSQVTSLTVGGFQIDGGATRGANLFHSFREFSVPTDGFAYFNNAPNIEHIITRVTGASVSNIDGVIAANGTANLFLINPNGIVFGSHASLNIGGSFFASTANSLVFGNDFEFSATNPQAPPLLTVSVPLGLQYGSTAGSIQVQGSFLQVPDGKTLALAGGNVQLDGAFLQAPGGRVELAGVGEPGTIGLEADHGSLRLSFPQDIARTDVSLKDTQIDVVSGGGGSITSYAQNLTIDSSIVKAGIGPSFGSVGTHAEDITLDATEEVKIGQQSIVANAVFRGATGNSGNVNIKASSLRLTDGAELGTFVFGHGNAGKVIVQAKDSVFLTGTRTILASDVAEGAVGQGGEINIQTASLSLTDDAQIGAVTGGRGDAGKIVIQANHSVSLAGRLTGILSNVGAEAVGQGGDIKIQTGALSLTDGAGLSASTFGQGDAGNVTVKADESIVLVDGQIFSAVREGAIGQGGAINIHAGSLSLSKGAAVDSSVEQGAIGQGGEINIQAGSISLANDAVLFADTSGQGNAGNITVQSNDFISLTNSKIYTNVESGASGQAGNIRIQTGSLSLIDGSRISNSTFGKGNAANIFVQANDSISLIGDTSAIISGVYFEAVGNGGDIQLEARSLSLTDGAQLFAATFGEGNAGNIRVNISDTVSLSGVGSMTGFSSGLLTNTEEGAGGQGGDIKVTTSALRVSDGAVLSALTRSAFNGGSITVDANTLEVTNGGQLLTTAFSSGDAGNITVNATDRIILAGSDSTFAARLVQFNQVDPDGPASGFFARTEGAGAAGNVRINTPQLTVKDRAQVSAATSGGNGGSITVTANHFETIDGGQLRTTTAGSNKAGNITLRVRDGVTLAGADSGLFANTDPGSSGNGGSIFISNPRTVVIRDGASVAVGSKGTGEGGNIQIQASSLTLNNKALISAETASNTGGNTVLQVQDLLLMRHSSRISTTAGTAQAGGNGGNITIDAQFIVAVPKENSDITANAFTGQGGNINITTQGIYGLEFRPRLTPLSDITASSDFGVNGTVQINTPGVDPSRGLGELPSNLVDATGLIDRHCTPRGGSAQRSSFTITGRGGLPPGPNDILQNESVITNWVTADPHTNPRPRNDTSGNPDTSGGAPSTERSAAPQTPTLIEAQGWVYGPNGEVILTAQAPHVTPHSPTLTPPTCSN